MADANADVVSINGLKARVPAVRKVAAAKEAGYGYRALLARGYRVYRKLRPSHAVAAGKDVRLCGLIGDTVHNGGALLALFHCAGIECPPVYVLSYGGDNAVHGDLFKFARSFRLAAALLIRRAKLHDLNLERFYFAVLPFYGGGRVEEAELNAL